jgi:predicted naringenin-chalcone synthase
MSLSILGIGTALPDNIVTQAEAVETAKVFCCTTDDERALLPMLYRGTGIKQRHMVLQQDVMHEVLAGEARTASAFLPKDKEDHDGPSTLDRMKRYAIEAPELATMAASDGLKRAGVSAQSVTHLVTVSCTGFGAPGVDIALFKRLGLPASAQRVNVGFMGCHAAINGLRVAHGLAAADPEARVLVCCVELCSLHFHYGWDPKKVVANALFADGAAALVGAAEPAGSKRPWQVISTASCLVPDSEYAMTWDIGNHGFEMTLSTRVPTLIAKNVRPFLDGWLAKYGLTVPEIKSWAIHPGGPRILSSIEQPLGIDEKATNVSREVLGDHGNMSSPTVLFILDKLMERQAPLPCVAIGFGPGLMAEAALIV